MRCRAIGDNALVYLGDAREVARMIRPANMIMTDPPYQLTSGGRGGEMGGCLSPKNYDNSGSIVTCDISWKEIMELCSAALPVGDAYVMCNNRNILEMLASAALAGFSYHNLLVWNKRSATANRWYMKNCEFTGYFYKGPAKSINDCSSKQLIECPQADETNHPTEKPVALMRHYIENSTQPGQLVFDPFLGSGTTGVAALRAGRTFIGCEIEEKYFDVACRRIENYRQNGELL